jgi:hypothetical protein
MGLGYITSVTDEENNSLERNQAEDFGFGWKLNTSVQLNVDPFNNVALDA